MTTQLYADGIGSISVTGPIVRIDLVTVLPNQRDAQGRMATQTQAQLIMPLDAFVRTADALQQSLQQLVKAGVLKANAAAPNETGEAPPTVVN